MVFPSSASKSLTSVHSLRIFLVSSWSSSSHWTPVHSRKLIRRSRTTDHLVSPQAHARLSPLSSVFLPSIGHITALKPPKRTLRKLDFVARKPIYHDHESVRTNSSQYMPPSMQLKQKPPRDTYCTFECCELSAENEVELPE